MEERKLVDKAVSIVEQYIREHVDPDAKPTVFVVWQAAVLDNFKCEIATTLPLGMRFELTYDSTEFQWYFNVFKMAERRVIPDV